MSLADPAESSDAIWPGFSRQPVKHLRLILIDDHPIVREGVAALLSLEADMVMVGEAGDIESGIEMVQRTQPDLVISDLTMPGCTGDVAVRKLCRQCPATKVLVLTAHDSLECMRESFAAGAVGYVRKDAMRIELLSAVRLAASGAHVTCGGVSDLVMRNWLRDCPPSQTAPDAQIDAEDRQILRLIALGVPTWRIAAELNRGVKAVEKHRASLMRRLNLNSTAAVARFAVRGNLLSREEVDQLFVTD